MRSCGWWCRAKGWSGLAVLVVVASCSGTGDTTAGTATVGDPGSGGALAEPIEPEPGPGYGVAAGGLTQVGFARVVAGTWLFGGVRDTPDGWVANTEAHLYDDEGHVLRSVEVPIAPGQFLLGPITQGYGDDGRALAVANMCETPGFDDQPTCGDVPTPVAYVLSDDSIEVLALPGEWAEQSVTPGEDGREVRGFVRLSGAFDGAGRFLMSRDVAPGAIDEVPTFVVRAAVIDPVEGRAEEVPLREDVHTASLVCASDGTVYSGVPVLSDELRLEGIQIWRQRPPDWEPELHIEYDGFATSNVNGGVLLCTEEVLMVELLAASGREVMAFDPASGDIIGRPTVLSSNTAPSQVLTADGDGYLLTTGGVDAPEGPPLLRVDYVKVSPQGQGVTIVGHRNTHLMVQAYGLDLGGRIADVARWVATPGRSQPPVFL